MFYNFFIFQFNFHLRLRPQPSPLCLALGAILMGTFGAGPGAFLELLRSGFGLFRGSGGGCLQSGFCNSARQGCQALPKKAKMAAKFGRIVMRIVGAHYLVECK